MDHVSNEQLASVLDGTARDIHGEELEAHLSGCAHCRRELQELSRVVDFVRDGEAHHDATGWQDRWRKESSRRLGVPAESVSSGDNVVPFAARIFRHWTPTVRMLAAAAATLVVLAYPSYLGLVRLPAAQRQLAATEGFYELHLLEGASRGHTGSTLVIEGDRPFVSLGFVPDDEQVRRYRLVDRQGAAIWSEELTAEQVARVLGAGGSYVVTFQIPSELLSAGDYRFRAYRLDGTREELTMDLALRIVRKK